MRFKFILALILFAGTAHASVAEKLWRASHILHAFDNQSWRAVCMATPYEQKDGRTYLVTSAHCLIGSSYAISQSKSMRRNLPAKVEYDQRVGDIAVLSVAKLIPVIPLGTVPFPGDDVIAVIAPNGQRKLLVAGMIASFPDQLDSHHTIAVHMSVWVGGSSGGALYCLNQEAICAIISGHWDKMRFLTAAQSVEILRTGKWRDK